jgi:hypothetical protein
VKEDKKMTLTNLKEKVDQLLLTINPEAKIYDFDNVNLGYYISDLEYDEKLDLVVAKFDSDDNGLNSLQ